MDGWVDVQRLAIVCVSGRVAGAQIREGGGWGRGASNKSTRVSYHHFVCVFYRFSYFFLFSFFVVVVVVVCYASILFAIHHSMTHALIAYIMCR